MFLKSITLNGFKAFAEKTTIHFEGGIGGFIGPNGCGKSNIIDAIKWAIGEQKMSELRSERVEEMIFHGSENKKSSNMAEVELVINNEKLILPLEYTEIAITRRLYRSGESEYLINKNTCRLKDIQKIFMGTGIGKTTYSIIAQGRIDKVLSQNPEERRFIFEEAASVSNYREKKKEYEKKIEKITENLSRINDLSHELEKQKKQLKTQADASESYFTLNKKLKQEEVKYLLYKKNLLEKQKNHLEEKNKKQIDDLEKKQTFLKTIEKKINDIEKIIKSNEENNKQMENQKISFQEKIRGLKQNKEILNKRYKDIIDRIRFRKEDIEQFKKEKEQQQQTIENLNKKIEEKSSDKESLLKKIETIEKKIKELKHNNHSLTIDIGQTKEALITTKKEQESLTKQHLLIIEEVVEEIDKIKNHLKEREKSNQKYQEDMESYFKDLTQKTRLISIPKDKKKYTIYLNEIKKKPQGEILKEFEILTFQVGEIKNILLEKEQFFKAFLEEKDPFYHFIFSTEGAYAKKEKIDQNLLLNKKKHKNLEQQIEALTQQKNNYKNEQEQLERKIIDLKNKASMIYQVITIAQKEREEKFSNINTIETRKRSSHLELKRVSNTLSDLEKEQKETDVQLNQLTKKNEINTEKLTKSMHQMGKESLILNQLEIKRENDLRTIKEIEKKKNDFTIQIQLINRDQENLSQNAKEQFSEDLSQYSKKEITLNLDPKMIKITLKEIAEKIKVLHPINPLAKKEYENILNRLTEIKKQKEDIEKAMSDLQEILKQIEKQSSEKFIQIFNLIKNNFDQIFCRLFNGGKAIIKLIDPQSPLNSGIDIMIQPPGKKFQSIHLFSGGEKSLIAISLMFAIFLVKTSPICLLDEVDAALDKENIRKLLKLFKDFKDKTQFVIISHNEKTFSIIDYAYGITMNEGISKAFSINFSNIEKKQAKTAL